MTEAASTAVGTAGFSEPRRLNFEFSGRGGEFFRIWIVNLVLTILTLGIYSAWAKVRTWRYFYGNTSLDGVSFEYHAAPIRILIGRVIAIALLIGLSMLQNLYPSAAFIVAPVYILAMPFFIKMSLRFNARMTSYRNVRFNFVGTYWDAFKAYILWPLAGLVTLGILWPLAVRAGKRYYVDNHTYGGRPFETVIPGWAIYGIYLLAFLLFLIIIGPGLYYFSHFLGPIKDIIGTGKEPSQENMQVMLAGGMPFIFLLYGAAIIVFFFINTKVTNLAVNKTVFDGRHGFSSTLGVLAMTWITLTNAVLTVITFSLFYPWARIRAARYRARHTSFLAASGLSEFISEAFEKQSAVGEEIADIWDLDIGI